MALLLNKHNKFFFPVFSQKVAIVRLRLWQRDSLKEGFSDRK